MVRTSFSVLPNGFAVAVNGTTQESLIAQWNTGTQYDYTSNSSWSSSNTSIATVQTGLVHGVATGSFTVTAGTSSEPVYANYCSQYPSCPIYGGGGGSSGGTAKPSISGISPSAGLVGTAINVTISGTGFAAGATVTGSNIAVSNVQVISSTQITATFTPANSISAGGNQSVTVTASGEPSNSANFFVQYPLHIYYVDTSITPNNGHSAIVSGTDINIIEANGQIPPNGSGVCGGYQWVSYGVHDQIGNVIENGTATFAESFSNISPSPDPFGNPYPQSPAVVDFAGSYLGDTYALWVSPPPTCEPANASDSFHQQWTATVGRSRTPSQP